MWWKSRSGNKSREKTEPEAAELRESGRAPLSEVAKKVKQVEIITRRKSSTLLTGQYKSRFKGHGMQFADFRVYQYGDDVRHIDWRTSARHQDTYVKTFEEERELNLMLAVDISPSTEFGTADGSKRYTLCLALAAIAFSALSNNDRVGLLLFADKVIRYVPPRKGRKHVLRIIDELLSAKSNAGSSSIESAVDMLNGVLKQQSVVVLASDFFASISKRSLSVLSRKHDLIAMRVIDQRDLELPPIGLIQLEDPETGENILVDSSSAWVRKQFSREQRQRLEEIGALLSRAGASAINLNTAEDPSKELLRFFLGRRRGGRR